MRASDYGQPVRKVKPSSVCRIVARGMKDEDDEYEPPADVMSDARWDEVLGEGPTTERRLELLDQLRRRLWR